MSARIGALAVCPAASTAAPPVAGGLAGRAFGATSSTGMKSRRRAGCAFGGSSTWRRNRRAASGGPASAAGSAAPAGRSCQQPRCSRPVSGRRFGSSAHQPTSAEREVRKWLHVEQVVDDRWQTQHRADSACGAPQLGQCHISELDGSCAVPKASGLDPPHEHHLCRFGASGDGSSGQPRKAALNARFAGLVTPHVHLGPEGGMSRVLGRAKPRICTPAVHPAREGCPSLAAREGCPSLAAAARRGMSAAGLPRAT
jgi:hypothetical protein